jgi:hypothetical protein
MKRDYLRILPIALSVALITACSDKEKEQKMLFYLKKEMIERCGTENKDCLAAVQQQFAACGRKYHELWHEYWDVSLDENKFKLYLYNMHQCIVDEKGKPYLYFPAPETY